MEKNIFIGVAIFFLIVTSLVSSLKIAQRKNCFDTRRFRTAFFGFWGIMLCLGIVTYLLSIIFNDWL